MVSGKEASGSLQTRIWSTSPAPIRYWSDETGSLAVSCCAHAGGKLMIPNMIQTEMQQPHCKRCPDIHRIYMVTAFRGPIILSLRLLSASRRLAGGDLHACFARGS